jgi:hypothetical protein
MTRTFRHPLASHAAGTVLGYRRDGRPIYAIAGGDGTGEGGGDAASGQPSGEQGGTDGGQAPPNGQQSATDGAGDSAATIARLQAELADARKEAGKTRVTAKQQAADTARQELAQQIGKALGIVKDDQPADPAQLMQQLADSQQEARRNTVELAAFKAAGEAGARADRLLNSRSFADKLAALDPSANDFGDKVKAAIKAEVDSDPDLYRAAKSGPAKGGAEFNGAPTGERKPATLHDAIAARMGG